MSNLFLMTLWFHTIELTSQIVNGTWSGGTYYAAEQYLIKKQDEYITQQIVERMKTELRLNKANVFN